MSKQKSLEEVLSSRLNLDTIKQNNTKYGKVKNPTLRKNQSPILNTVSHTEERNIEDEQYVDQRTIETNDNNYISVKIPEIIIINKDNFKNICLILLFSLFYIGLIAINNIILFKFTNIIWI